MRLLRSSEQVLHMFRKNYIQISRQGFRPSFGQNRHSRRSSSDRIFWIILKKLSESSSKIKNRVDTARKIQLDRFKEYNISANAKITPGLLQKTCILTKNAENLLKKAFDNMGLSARAYTRILKVARTIADLSFSEEIKSSHIAEAIQYRSLDRKYWSRKA